MPKRAATSTGAEAKPGDGDALVESGLLRQQMGDLGGARRDFQAALKTSVGGGRETRIWTR